MAGGGVGEAMLIGAAMGAGTGAVTSAIDKKDPLQGALMGAVGGAAMGGIGSAVGGAATSATEQLGEKAIEKGVEQGVEQGVNTAAQSAAQNQAMENMTRAGLSFDQQAGIIQGAQSGSSTAGNQAMTQAGMNFGQQQGVYGAFQPGASAPASAPPPSGGAAQWMAGGKGTGFAPGMTNAQAYGAGAAGGISGIYAAQNLPPNEPFPTGNEDSYSGPLSYFKYDPEKYKVNTPTPRVYEARYGMADGGIASLTQDSMSPMSNPVYPQSQQQQTSFATSPQMPNSMRSAMASDYDTRTNPSLGTEFPMGYANGGIARFGGGGFMGIGNQERGGFEGVMSSMQPGGALGQLEGKVYGALDGDKWNPGGALGSINPGANRYHEQKREEEEKKRAEQEAAQRQVALQQAAIARNTSMQGNMARGGIASLGGYSDGGQLLRGPGDGVSDSIPASISGKQPARLADGEFVVPARIVSELGNGSTDAGARRLYDMMDRVQRRRGTTVGQGKVAKNTKAYKELPV